MEAPDDEQEVALAGGMGSGGAVVRVGATVRRPVREWSASVDAFLDHLAAVGFDGAPRRLGIDAKGREVLTFIDGAVAVPPFPAWAAGEELLVSVAELQRAMHEASRSFTIPPGCRLAAGQPPAAWTRRDRVPQRPVRGERRHPRRPGVGVHRLRLRRPGRSADRHRHRRPPLGAGARPARPRPGVGGHRPGRTDGRLPRRPPARRAGAGPCACELGDFLDRALVSMRERAEAGLAMYVAAWANGYPAQNRRSRAWLDANASKW